MSSNKEHMRTLEIDAVDRAELSSLTSKLADFYGSVMDTYQDRINLALKHEILRNPDYAEDYLDAMEFFNSVLLCLGSHGMLAEKLYFKLDADLKKEHEIEQAKYKLETA